MKISVFEISSENPLDVQHYIKEIEGDIQRYADEVRCYIEEKPTELNLQTIKATEDKKGVLVQYYNRNFRKSIHHYAYPII